MAHARFPFRLGLGREAAEQERERPQPFWLGPELSRLAVEFVIKYVLFCYRRYDAASFESYWPRRVWLVFLAKFG